MVGSEIYYNGLWLELKGADDYGKPNFIKFENGNRVYFTLSDSVGIPELMKEPYLAQAPVKFEAIDEDRLRFYEKGRKTSFFNDKPSTMEDIIIQKDYQRLLPTETQMRDQEIVIKTYSFKHKNFTTNVRFNTITDIPFIQEMNKRLGKEGSKILLERFDNTLFLAFYNNGIRGNLLPIREIDNDKIVLYAFEKEPYEITGYAV